jgi:AcrR family transcriptional regulator
VSASSAAGAAASTRAALVDTATRLFAERGVFQVSLAEIVRASGQRNASAVHYHFGTRDQLLYEVLEPTVRRLHARRVELLADAVRSPDGEARAVVEAIVRPLVELARQGWRERAWMAIGTEVGDAIERVPPEIAALLREAGGAEALDVLTQRCPPLPADIWRTRTNICIGFVSRAATDRAQSLDANEREPQARLADEHFVQNLIDMFLGALTAPLTAVRQST